MTLSEEKKGWQCALEDMDVSLSDIYESDTPGPYFARLRKEDPIHYCKDSLTGPYWSITKYDDIVAVESNPKVFSSEVGGVSLINMEDEAIKVETFMAMDPPRHAEKRKTVSPSVAPARLKDMEPLIRERVINILDGLPIGESFDWVDKVAVELTSGMLATLFGFPYEERRKLVHWSDVATSSPQLMGDAGLPDEVRFAEMSKCMMEFTALWNQRAAEPPGMDLISMLAHGEATKDLPSRPLEFLGNIMLLIIGGNDTTRNSISGGVVALNQYPEEYEKLRKDAGLIPNMVSEIIRWQTPVLHMRRTATEDFELGGKTIKNGDRVVMWYISGNRDEAIFDNPEAFIIDRPNAGRHVSFGFGIHRCMGSRLAQLQLRVLWEEIHKRFHFVEMTGEPKRLANNFIRGITELPVKLHAI